MARCVADLISQWGIATHSLLFYHARCAANLGAGRKRTSAPQACGTRDVSRHALMPQDDRLIDFHKSQGATTNTHPRQTGFAASRIRVESGSEWSRKPIVQGRSP